MADTNIFQAEFFRRNRLLAGGSAFRLLVTGAQSVVLVVRDYTGMGRLVSDYCLYIVRHLVSR